METIAMAKVSTSAPDARALGFLRAADNITMNRARLLTDASARARAMADAGYAAPMMRADIAVPGENVLATLKLGVWMMREGEFISDHDMKVAEALRMAEAEYRTRPNVYVADTLASANLCQRGCP